MAQNQLSIGFQGARYFNVEEQITPKLPTVEFTNLRFKRNISNKFSIYANVNLRTEIYFRKLIGTSAQLVENIYSEENEGKILSRRKFDHFDLGLEYLLFNKGQHGFSLSTGLAHTRGEDQYLVSMNLVDTGSPIPHSIGVEIRYEKANYWGGIISGLYTYNFKDNWSVGIGLAYRHYSNGFPSLINHGLFASYSF